jgi:hypothetical protein
MAHRDAWRPPANPRPVVVFIVAAYRYAAAMTLLLARAVAVPSVGVDKLLRPSIVAIAVLASFVLACVRPDRAPAPDASAAPSVEPVGAVPTTPAAPTAANTDPGTPSQTPQAKAEPGTSTACKTDADCRTFSDACGICSCRPFAKTSPDPKCPGPRMSCLIDPCMGLRTICRNGNCLIGEPSDAAPLDVKWGMAKDASSDNGAGKRADGGPSGATSATPKVADAATRD